MDSHRALGRRGNEASGSQEEGFALILAILALLLLTFLGLTLATTTSTELQISNNYRWSQQALYNAEAGVEAAKTLLRSMTWNTGPPGILPPARTTAWTGEQAVNDPPPAAPYARNDEWNNVTRNFENGACDKRGNGVGYGVVLDDGDAGAPYQNKTTLFGQTLNGAFTVWVRRPYVSGNFTAPACDGCWLDWTPNNVLVLTSEGVAPYTGGTITTAVAQTYRAVQVIEVSLTAGATEQEAGCEFYGGQTGLGPSGTNFNPCGVGAGASITAGLPGATGGTDVTPTAQ
jgi:hypothetical protein